MSSVAHSGMRFVAVLGVEWSTLTLIEPAPVGIKIATLALAAAVLGVLELRARFEKLGKWVFPASLGALLGAYALTCVLAFFWSSLSLQAVVVAAPWLLAAFGILGIASGFYRAVGSASPEAPITAPSVLVDAPGIDTQTRQNLISLLEFAVNRSTELWLTDLVMKTPIEPYAVPSPVSADVTTAQKAADFVRHASIQLRQSVSHRYQDFLLCIANAEKDAERMVEEMPPAERPSGVDPLVLRRCAIANLQCLRANEFLQGERRELGQKLVALRSKLVEELSARSPN
jgi:hypothetical protein